MQCENFILPWKQMNNTIKKTFYTCSSESFFWKYEKNFKKAVKFRSFLGIDEFFSKINFEIFWKYMIKKIQVKHSQCDSIIFTNIFSFENSK